jgi:hypothetical protein
MTMHFFTAGVFVLSQMSYVFTLYITLHFWIHGPSILSLFRSACVPKWIVLDQPKYTAPIILMIYDRLIDVSAVTSPEKSDTCSRLRVRVGAAK